MTSAATTPSTHATRSALETWVWRDASKDDSASSGTRRAA